jgi:hypothetical protein
VNEKAITRGELEDKLGRYFTMKCSNCLTTKEYHVNNIRAGVDRKKILYFGLFMVTIMALLTLLFFNAGVIIWLVLVLPIVAFSYYYGLRSTAANQFNRMLIKRDK